MTDTVKSNGLMYKIQSIIEKHIVPPLNKAASNYWFSLAADAILYIVPFSMVSAIPSLWEFASNFLTFLPDISAITTYSFGLVGLFVVFAIPYNCMVKEDHRDRGLMAGFTAIGTYMMCMNAVTTDDGTLFNMNKFGAGGMFTAMVVGLIVAAIFRAFATKSFFSEDSMVPDFVKSWFDSVVAILICLVISWVVSCVAVLDVFTLIGVLLSPVTGFAQSLPGVVIISLVRDVFYFFGVSGWVFTTVTLPITQGAMAENMAAAAAGQAIPNINAYGLSRYYMIGGEGNTLPLAIFMLFSKSKKNKTLGRATLVPSLFNINEPLIFSSVVNNPYYFVPMVLQSIILPANAYLWIQLGFASRHTVMFAMNNLPNAVSAFFLSGGDWRNALLVVVNLALAAIIWYPFFKAYDRHQAKVETDAAMAKTA